MARLSNPLSSNCPSFICLSSICLSSICVGLFASGGRQGLGGETPVRTLRVPNGGIQPLIARGKEGELLLVYYSGKPGSGDLYLLRSRDDGDTFGKPLRINQQEGSAVATGNIRGAQIAVGKNGRIHVAWNGSSRAKPRGLANPEAPEDSPYRLSAPMLYTRLRDDGSGFEPERNLMRKTFALDGGGSVAADARGKVYVLWHGASPDGKRGEGGRAVWIARSTDDGKTFSTESRANSEPTGACGCCGLRCFVADGDTDDAFAVERYGVSESDPRRDDDEPGVVRDREFRVGGLSANDVDTQFHQDTGDLVQLVAAHEHGDSRSRWFRRCGLYTESVSRTRTLPGFRAGDRRGDLLGADRCFRDG